MKVVILSKSESVLTDQWLNLYLQMLSFFKIISQCSCKLFPTQKFFEFVGVVLRKLELHENKMKRLRRSFFFQESITQTPFAKSARCKVIEK